MHYGEVVCAEQAEDEHHNEETAVAIQTVVEELPKRRWCPRSPRLLTVDSVQSVSHKHVQARNKENPSRNGILIGTGVCRRREIIVVKCYQQIVDDGEHKAGKGDEIRSDPHWEEL